MVPEAANDKDSRMWGMFCHLAALIGYIGVPPAIIIGPLIVWLIKKEEYPFVDDQGKESLNFQISMAIYGIICIPFMLIVIGFFMLGFLIVADLVLVIVAAVKANNGESYRYPCCIRFIK